MLDAGAVPRLIGTNTNTPAAMVAKRAAAFILAGENPPPLHLFPKYPGGVARNGRRGQRPLPPPAPLNRPIRPPRPG